MAIDVEDYYRQYGPMVLRRCRKLLGNEQRAVDAMQDTFVKLLRYQDRLKDQAPSSLLFRMATNTCLNQIRASQRRPEDPNGELLSQVAALDEPETESRLNARGLLSRLFSKERTSTRVIRPTTSRPPAPSSPRSSPARKS